MRRSHKNSGMTLMEILVVLTIILILMGAVITAANALRRRAAVDLTQSMLDVLDLAIQQYYDDRGQFPFFTHDDPDADGTYTLRQDISGDNRLLDEFIGAYTPVSGTIPPNPTVDPILLAFETSSALFYYLDRNTDSSQIAEAVSDSLITNKDATGTGVTITIQTLPPKTIDLPRYIDAWQTSIRYQYRTGAAFPVLTSAGPDKKMDTADDVTNE